MEYRINKYLAMSGVCSRRGADKLIEDGLVTINGAVAVAGDKVTEADEVMVQGKVVKVQNTFLVAFYKPKGVTCTNADEHADLIIDDVFHHEPKLNYAGRLDRDSEGLLIMTNDGELIDKMMRSRNNHEKEYVVETTEKINDKDLKEMEKGVYIEELDVHTKPCKIEKVGDCVFKIVLTEGLNRQIRRMCQIYGMNVKKLTRIRVCNVLVGDLKPGESRDIVGEERAKLYEITGCTDRG